MKKKYCLILFVLIVHSVYSQGIRKSYLEMTDSEKLQLQTAFYSLRDMDNDGVADTDTNDDDLIYDMSEFHLEYFDFDGTDPDRLDIHLNLSRFASLSEPDKEIFFPWHRAMLFELEQAMQDLNENLSMPYWDNTQIDGYDNTTVVDLINSTVFTPDFLGPFDADWGLNRDVGDREDTLPDSSDVVDAFLLTDFFEFSNEVERQNIHSGAHRWVGGVMPTSASARDPVFYLHHAYVDKTWHEWQVINGTSAYLRDDMLRYDGTYSFYGNTLPLIDPDDLVNSDVYGTFYAENGFAILDNYTVSNTYNSKENFYYQFIIEAKDNFEIPNGTNCKFESVNEIVLKPGFTAESGASFVAVIDADNDIATLAARGGGGSQKGVYNPFDPNPNTQDILFEESDEVNDVTIVNTFPNPFNDNIVVKFDERVRNCRVEIFDMLGKVIRDDTYRNVESLTITNLGDLPNGNYLLRVTNIDSEEMIINRRFIKL